MKHLKRIWIVALALALLAALTVFASAKNAENAYQTTYSDGPIKEVIAPGIYNFIYSPDPIRVMESLDLKPLLDQSVQGKTLSWSSGNTNIVSVSQDGVIIGLSSGDAMVTGILVEENLISQHMFNIRILASNPTTLSLSPTSIVLFEGETRTLGLTIQPKDFVKYVEWSSTNPSVATVDIYGVVTAHSSGNAIIKAVCGNKEVSCSVTVKKTATTVDSGTQVKIVPLLQNKKGSLNANETETFSFNLLVPATIRYNNTGKTNTIVKLYSGQSSLIYDSGSALTEKTMTKSLNAGKYEIAVKNPSLTAACDYSFSLEQAVTLNPSAFGIEYNSMVMPVNADMKLYVTALSSGRVDYQNLNEDVISIKTSSSTTDSYCEITAKSCGEADILIASGSDAMLFHVKVINPTRTIVYLDSISGSLKPNESESFSFNLPEVVFLQISGLPSYDLVTVIKDSSGKKVFDSSTTSKYGTKYVYLQKGACQITISNPTKYTSSYSRFTVKALLITEVPTTSLSLNNTNVNLLKGKTITLKASFTPANATGSLTWESSNSNVATVKDGVVTGKKFGTAVITAKKGDKTATCKVTVCDVTVEKVSISGKDKIIKGSTSYYSASYSPKTESTKTAVWSSSDPSVASFRTNGRLEAYKLGVTTITAKIDNKTATKKVCVYTDNIKYTGFVGGKYSFLEDAQEIKGYQNARWSVKNTNKAKINQKGVIKVLEAGYNYVYATIDGNQYQWKFYAEKLPELKANKKMHLYVCKQKEYNSGTITVKNAGDSLTFKSSDKSVAVVDSSGRVTAKSPGEATITIKSGNQKCKCTVRVDKLAYGYMKGSVVTLSGYRGGYAPEYGAKIKAYDLDDDERCYSFKQNNETTYSIKLPVGRYKVYFLSGNCEDFSTFNITTNKTISYNARLS